MKKGANTCENRILREILLHPAFGWGTKPARTDCLWNNMLVLIFLARRRNPVGKGGGKGKRVWTKETGKIG